MKGSAVVIWSLLENIFNISQLVSYIVGNYTISEEIAKPIVFKFIETLKNEQLIVSLSEQDILPTILITGDKKAFEEPIIEIFRDLQELLLLDPIHEVDEVQGWPTAKQ